MPLIERDSPEWLILRLYHDQSGDADVAARLDKESTLDKKAAMLYYLAEFYAVRGVQTLADTYHLTVLGLNRQGLIEWRLNEWALEKRGL